jgi:hypothetical protein
MAHDEPADLFLVVGVVAAYVVLDVLTRWAAGIDAVDVFEPLLVWRMVISNPIPIVLLIAAIAGVQRFGRGALLADWTAVDHGVVLRWVATPIVVISTWVGATYEFNFFVDQWHAADRFLLVALAVGAWFRPIVLVAFVLQARLIAEQFAVPFGALASQNISELLMICLLVIVAMYAVAAVVGTTESSGVMLVLATVVATHFFLPGFAKLRLGIDWFTDNEIGNFAWNSYVAGWMGGGDGGWARSVSSVARTLRLPIALGTVLIEVGAIVAVLHRRLLRWWLPAWVVFHLSIFVMSGFLLLEWIVVEVVLFVVLTRRSLVDWLSRNDTPARALLAVGLVVVAGPIIYHPPTLAWFDSRVSYAYEIEAVGESGAAYHVSLSEMAPYQQDFGFVFAQFRERPELVRGYGAIGDVWLFEQLQAVEDFDDIDALEAIDDPTSEFTRDQSEQMVLRWFDHANAHGDPSWFPLGAPAKYWVGRPDDVFDFGERLQSVEVVSVRSIIADDADDVRRDRSTVLSVVADDSGRGQIAVVD